MSTESHDPGTNDTNEAIDTYFSDNKKSALLIPDPQAWYTSSVQKRHSLNGFKPASRILERMSLASTEQQSIRHRLNNYQTDLHENIVSTLEHSIQVSDTFYNYFIDEHIETPKSLKKTLKFPTEDSETESESDDDLTFLPPPPQSAPLGEINLVSSVAELSKPNLANNVLLTYSLGSSEQPIALPINNLAIHTNLNEIDTSMPLKATQDIFAKNYTESKPYPSYTAADNLRRRAVQGSGPSSEIARKKILDRKISEEGYIDPFNISDDRDEDVLSATNEAEEARYNTALLDVITNTRTSKASRYQEEIKGNRIDSNGSAEEKVLLDTIIDKAKPLDIRKHPYDHNSFLMAIRGPPNNIRHIEEEQPPAKDLFIDADTVSGAAGAFTLVESIEAYPPYKVHPGTGCYLSTIINYDEAREQVDRPSFKIEPLQGELEYQKDESRFLGDFNSGTYLQMWRYPSLYYAPTYSHTPPIKLFVLSRDPKGTFTIRRPEVIYSSAQQHPIETVMEPGRGGDRILSVDYIGYRCRTYLHHELLKATNIAEKISEYSSDELDKKLNDFTTDVKKLGPPPIVDKCLSYFGSVLNREYFINSIFNQYAESKAYGGGHRYQLKDDMKMTATQLRSKCTPENMHNYEAMIRGVYRLRKWFLNPNNSLNKTLIYCLLTKNTQHSAIGFDELTNWLKIVVAMTPWQHTTNFKSALSIRQNSQSVPKPPSVIPDTVITKGRRGGIGTTLALFYDEPEQAPRHDNEDKEDLRKLETTKLDELLLKLNFKETEFKTLHRWRKVDLIAARAGVYARLGYSEFSKYSRPARSQVEQAKNNLKNSMDDIFKNEITLLHREEADFSQESNFDTSRQTMAQAERLKQFTDSDERISDTQSTLESDHSLVVLVDHSAPQYTEWLVPSYALKNPLDLANKTLKQNRKTKTKQTDARIQYIHLIYEDNNGRKRHVLIYDDLRVQSFTDLYRYYSQIFSPLYLGHCYLTIGLPPTIFSDKMTFIRKETEKTDKNKRGRKRKNSSETVNDDVDELHNYSETNDENNSAPVEHKPRGIIKRLGPARIDYKEVCMRVFTNVLKEQKHSTAMYVTYDQILELCPNYQIVIPERVVLPETFKRYKDSSPSEFTAFTPYYMLLDIEAFVRNTTYYWSFFPSEIRETVINGSDGLIQCTVYPYLKDAALTILNDENLKTATETLCNALKTSTADNEIEPSDVEDQFEEARKVLAEKVEQIVSDPYYCSQFACTEEQWQQYNNDHPEIKILTREESEQQVHFDMDNDVTNTTNEPDENVKDEIGDDDVDFSLVVDEDQL